MFFTWKPIHLNGSTFKIQINHFRWLIVDKLMMYARMMDILWVAPSVTLLSVALMQATRSFVEWTFNWVMMRVGYFVFFSGLFVDKVYLLSNPTFFLFWIGLSISLNLILIRVSGYVEYSFKVGWCLHFVCCGSKEIMRLKEWYVIVPVWIGETCVMYEIHNLCIISWDMYSTTICERSPRR